MIAVRRRYDIRSVPVTSEYRVDVGPAVERCSRLDINRARLVMSAGHNASGARSRERSARLQRRQSGRRPVTTLGRLYDVLTAAYFAGELLDDDARARRLSLFDVCIVQFWNLFPLSTCAISLTLLSPQSSSPLYSAVLLLRFTDVGLYRTRRK